jgi:N-acetyl-anhydromuramyl-L-alanine amidase AmpD
VRSSLSPARSAFRLAAAAVLLVCGTAGRSQEPPFPEDAPEQRLRDDAEPRNSWRYIVIHHSATPTGNAVTFDAMHRRKGWDGVAYHFVIDNGKGGADGRLEVTHRWRDQKHGAHAGPLPPGAYASGEDARNDFNEFGIGICLVGNFEKKPPTRAQMQTLARLVARLRSLYDVPAENVVGHRHVRSTACPGRLFPWRTLFAMLELPAPAHLARRPALATTELCRWCLEQPETVSRAPFGGSAAGSDLPPPLLLHRR